LLKPRWSRALGCLRQKKWKEGTALGSKAAIEATIAPCDNRKRESVKKTDQWKRHNPRVNDRSSPFGPQGGSRVEGKEEASDKQCMSEGVNNLRGRSKRPVNTNAERRGPDEGYSVRPVSVAFLADQRKRGEGRQPGVGLGLA